MPKIKEAVVHKDMLGRDVAVGDTVAFSQYNVLYIGKVMKNTAKLIHCSPIRHDGLRAWGSQQMPGTVIKLEDPAVLAWILKGAKTKANIMYGN